MIIIFFFQAEDGIRDRDVTGVQTCALPIFELRIAAVENTNILDNLAVGNLPVGCFDETKLVDAGKTRQARNQSDVWTFRRLNRTNAAIVSRVNVTNFKSRALT